jgi:gliding motility-associated-like protein
VILSSNIVSGNTWSTGDTTQSITVTSTGTYTVSYANAAGCISSVASQLVTVNPLPTTPTISAGGPLTICTGSTVTLTSSASTGNTWSNGATTQSITVGTAGTYSVTITASGCTATSNSVTIVLSTAPNAPTITASSSSICPGQTVTLTSSSASGNTWSTGATTQAITISAAGTYSVFYTNANGCNSTNASVTITATTPPTVSVNSATICQSQSATLTATASPIGGTYTWSPGGNTNSTLTVSPNTTTTYNVVYQLNGCVSAPASGTVTVNSVPTVTFIANQVSGCSPLTVQFNNTTSGNPTNCQWSFSNGASAVGCQSSYTFTNSGCYDVTLTNTVGGCTVSQTLTDYVCVTSPPIANFSMNPNEFTASPQNVTFYNNSSGATSYLWNFGDGSTSTVLNPSHIFNNTQGGYTVSLTATNAAGCTDVYQIGIGYVDGVEYYIPNTFTPDGDGYNQTFQPVFTSGFDPYNFHMMIFNRWGELIFESFDASQGWDGSYGLKGRPSEDGIYTYKIVFKNPKIDDRIIVSGHVTLIR